MEIKNLPVGARIRDKNGLFDYYVAAQNHPGYEGTTLLSAQVVLIGPLDAAERTASAEPKQQMTYGNNDFELSNLLQWLGSDQDDWYIPAHDLDSPPKYPNVRNGVRGYHHQPGYLSMLPEAVRRHLLASQVPVHCLDENEVPSVKYVTASVFIPSRTEMGMGDDYGVPEGTPLPLLRDIRYRKAFLLERAAADYDGPWRPAFPMRAGGAWRYWLRSPHLAYKYLSRYVAEMGGLSFAPAWYEIIGVRPMMNVSGDLQVWSIKEAVNCYSVGEVQI